MLIHIVSSNCLVPPGNKLLPELILTKSVAIRRQTSPMRSIMLLIRKVDITKVYQFFSACIDVIFHQPCYYVTRFWTFNIHEYLIASYEILRVVMQGLCRNSTFRGRRNEFDGVSNHRRLGCLPNRLFRHRSNKISRLRVTGLCGGIYRWPVNFLQKGPVTQKMFPFDDVIAIYIHKM